MSNYKDEIQLIVEDISEKEYACNFYQLGDNDQYNVFRCAETDWAEKKMIQAEDLYDRLTGN